MPEFNPRLRWWLLGLLVSLPWVAMGMPLFSSGFMNGLAFGTVGYVLSVLTKGSDLGSGNGLPFLLVGLVLGLLCIGIGSAEVPSGSWSKALIFAGALAGWGVAQIVHGLVRKWMQ